MADRITIDFTPDKLDELIKAHDVCLDAGKNYFTFDGHKFDVRFAEYLIVYLEAEFSE